MDGICELCKREVETTSHHLIPKQIHSKDWCKRMFTRDEMKNRRADLCGDCHPMVHQYFTHSELGKIYNSIDELLTHEKVSKFVEWVSRQNKKAKR